MTTDNPWGSIPEEDLNAATEEMRLEEKEKRRPGKRRPKGDSDKKRKTITKKSSGEDAIQDTMDALITLGHNSLERISEDRYLGTAIFSFRDSHDGNSIKASSVSDCKLAILGPDIIHSCANAIARSSGLANYNVLEMMAQALRGEEETH
jgi:hypothetical protein